MTIDLSDLVLRLSKGSPLTPEEGDGNFTALKNAIVAMSATLGVTLNDDGSLTAASVNTAAIQDRAVTQGKLSLTSTFIVEDTGSANAITVALTPAATALAKGILLFIKVKVTNTTAATINLDGIGATSLKKRVNGNQVDVSAGDLVANTMVVVWYDGTYWELIAPIRTPEPHGIQIFTSPGNGTFVVPQNVYSIDVSLVGAGGGGGGNSSAAGGGGGGYCRKKWSVTPGQSIPYSVGAGGTPQSTFGFGAAANGGDTTFNGSQIANGGLSGTSGGGGGSYSGADIGSAGLPSKSTFGSGATKPSGGSAMHEFSRGSTSVLDGGQFTSDPLFGGGGYGDTDSGGGSSAIAGADGLIIVEW